VFVEDTALLTPACAIITRPGALSRRPEVAAVREALRPFFRTFETILAPGTVDAGDIMKVGSDYYIGLSERTNREGARQVQHILQDHGMQGILIPVKEGLHLKSGLSYLEDNHLLISGKFLQMPCFEPFEQLRLPECESYAANSVWINNKVLVPRGFPGALAKIREAGYEIIELDMSEFRKQDGGLSCLSLRF
jgi:dimethylargininase